MVYRALSERYGWTPEEVGRLTLAQAYYYCRDEAEARGQTSAAAAKFMAMIYNASDRAEKAKAGRR